ncbi:HET-domain-containing protein, partial [Stipitochalara longipes BDJ]
MLPSRVVDLGEGKDSPIRLHINQNGSRAQYAALSYCWGGDQPYKTTLLNLNTYTQELDAKVFPKTLSDAIRVCRAIGMRYIWIDALCIIQDDPEDKAKQISQMGKIYKDATFTLMAASASSVSEGFLGNAKVDAPDAKLPFHIDKDSFGAVFVRSCYNNPYFFDEEPIFNRAWTLQEMLLSSRILMFDSYQITLKCGLQSFRPPIDTFFGPELAKEYDGNALFVEDYMDSLAQEITSKQSQLWTSIMAEYSRRDISVIEDRYPALAGVTEELQKIWGGKFIAGFWEDYLVQHLGWVGGVNNEEFGGRKWESRLEGPSWSW